MLRPVRLESLTPTPNASPDQVLKLVRVEGASLYVRKALATLTCHLAKAAANVPILARAGAVSALHDEQESNPKLRRQKVQVALRRLCARLTEEEHATLLASLPQRERALAS